MYNWALAKALGGTFVLRIEDTDRARSTDESLRIILEGLRWLGIDWDEGPEKGGDYGPYFQMQRLDRYAEVAQKLLDSGHAYRCYCSPERIEAVREQQKAQKSSFLGYDGHCRNLSDAERKANEQQGIAPNLRFRMPEARLVRVHDLIRGDVEVNTKELDDWVMLRADGVPLYNFACVVDDVDMQITHVVRGEEHFLNGIKQQLVFEAIGAPCPLYAHIPLILNQKGQKLSKRDPGVMSVLEYRDQGYPPEAVFNYIALLGWGFSADRDVFTRDEMVAAFRIENVGKAGAKFDPEKLHWMCGEYVRRWSPSDCLDRARPWLSTVPDAAFRTHRPWMENVVACYQERVTLLADFAGKIGWLFEDPAPDEAAAKNLTKHEGSGQWLAAYADELAKANLPPSWPAARGGADEAVALPSKKDAPAPAAAFDTPARIEVLTREFTERIGVKFGHFVHPVRAALTGTDKGPGLFDVIFLLGGPTCVRRLRAHAGG
jgi:glutamyl-tRNA synthetase